MESITTGEHKERNMTKMDVRITRDSCTEIRTVNEKNLYADIANYICQLSPPDTILIETPYGNAEYQLIKKGGAFFVREESNNIALPDTADYDPVYLVCVNPTWNNYKFYKIEDVGGGQICATYGRIGAAANELFGERTHYYPKRMYWIKVLEKLNKGYKDMTDIYLTTNRDSSNADEQKEDDTSKNNSISLQLYNLLKRYSRYVVESSCISSTITRKMLEESRGLLLEMYNESSDIEKFNALLLKLLAVSPRKVKDVQSLLAKSVSDFGKIIDREENLLMAMEAVVVDPEWNDRTEGFENQNIEVYLATEKQREEVMKHLSTQLISKVKNIYRVIPNRQKERFNQYLKDRKIKSVKQFWHGSKNENWLSIITNGLLLRPNAAITGKMLGDGIYFAPSSMKSWGYSSYHNTYWARGKSDIAFMGLYACAYGTPKNVVTPAIYS